MDSILKERLIEVIHLIVKGGVEISDEVLLQKLLSHIEKLKSADSNFLTLEEMDLDKLIHALITLETEPSCKQFGINLISIGLKFALSINSEIINEIKLLFQHWMNSISKQSDALFCSAILEMLIKIIQNDILIESLISKECIETAVNCLQSKNFYIRIAAQNFLSCFISKTTNKESREKFPNTSIIAKDTLSYFLSKLTDDMDDGMAWEKTANVLLPIIKNLCIDNKDIVEQIRVPLLKLFSHKNRGIRSALCEIYAVSLAQISANKDLVDEIIKFLDDALLIQNFAGWMLTRLENPLDDVAKHLLLLLLLPLQSTKTSPKILTSAVGNVAQFLQVLNNNESREAVINRLCCLLEESLNENLAFGCQRLQIAIIDCFLNMIQNDWQVGFENGHQLTKVILQILEKRNVQSLVLTKTLTLLGQLLKRNLIFGATDVKMVTMSSSDILQKVAICLASLLCHPEWEIRDSAVELIICFADTAPESKDVENALLANRIPQMTWEQLAFEEESFVRSSVLIALLHFTKIREIWNLLTDQYSEEAIVLRIFKLLSEDGDDVVRRSACKLLFCWYFCNDFSMYKNCIKVAMQQAMKDFDWEVKLQALEFWRKLFFDLQHSQKIHMFDETFADTHSREDKDNCLVFLNKLNDEGFCFSLLQGIDDCDVAVKLQAAQFLQMLKTGLIEIGLIDEKVYNEDSLSKGDQEMAEDDNVPSFVSVPFNYEVVETILQKPDKDTVESLMVRQKKTLDDDVIHPLNENITVISLDLFLEKLANLDLEIIVKELQKSTDLHEENLEYLIDDILPSGENAKNITIDCY